MLYVYEITNNPKYGNTDGLSAKDKKICLESNDNIDDWDNFSKDFPELVDERKYSYKLGFTEESTPSYKCIVRYELKTVGRKVDRSAVEKIDHKLDLYRICRKDNYIYNCSKETILKTVNMFINKP